MKKILSIIIPAYNMEQYLQRCCDSLIVGDKRLADSLEVIIVNDGSKDRTAEIARSIVSQNSGTFRLIDKQNGNYGSCINAALKEISGEYVKVLDADDTFDTASLEKYLLALEGCNADVVFSNFNFVNPAGQVTRSAVSSLEAGLVKDVATLPESACRDMEMQNIAYRASCFANLGYRQTEGISYTDQEWMFLPMSQARTYQYVPVPLYRYLVGRDGQTIDRDTYLRNRWMVVAITQKLLSLYSQLAGNEIAPGAERYLRIRLMRRLEIAYHLALLEPKRYDRMQTIRDLDSSLSRNSPELYGETARLSSGKPFNFKYVACWRASKNDSPLKFRMYWLVCRFWRWIRRKG